MNKICEDIHRLFNQLKRFTFPFDENDVPFNGLYVLFEKGETGHGVDRIVRVGTHRGDNKLRERLKEHYPKENKDRSIFRKSIGKAILNKRSDPFLEYWNVDLIPREARAKYRSRDNINKQHVIEKEVSEYIQKNSFVVCEIRDKQQRHYFESKIISTISLCSGCQPSANWLGLYSPNEKIRNSGLWQVNELYKQPLSERDNDLLREYCCPK